MKRYQTHMSLFMITMCVIKFDIPAYIAKYIVNEGILFNAIVMIMNPIDVRCYYYDMRM